MLLPTSFPTSSGRRSPSLLKRALTLVEALLLVSFIGGMVVACDGGAAPATPTATARATATPVNPNASAPIYRDAVTTAERRLSAATSKFSSDCANQDISQQVCVNDLQGIHDATVNFQSTLDQHPAPPCLKAVDARLREALTDYHDGITLIKQGAESKDTASVQAGADMLADGDKEYTHAMVEMDEAPCEISTPTATGV